MDGYLFFSKANTARQTIELHEHIGVDTLRFKKYVMFQNEVCSLSIYIFGL